MLQTFEQQTTSPTTHYVSAPTPPISIPGTPSNGSSAAQIAKPTSNMSITPHHNIIIVTGPAGCGKSTVGVYLAKQYGFEYLEGDDSHPPVNVQKMKNNIPLDDADRWDWLISLRDKALKALREGSKGVVITCSALKKKYRDVIRTAKLYDEDPNATVHFVYLRASKEILLARVAARQNHYMKDTMVLSQLAALEEPDENELKQLKDVAIIDVSGTMSEVQALATAAVDEILAST